MANDDVGSLDLLGFVPKLVRGLVAVVLPFGNGLDGKLDSIWSQMSVNK